MESWLQNSIIYQIFPERFAIGENRTFTDKQAIAGQYPDNGIFKSWDQLPEPGPECQFEFFGGDLQGISEKLDHLENLGVNTLYLNPIFPAPSNHKYDALTYRDVDAGLGGMDALDTLIQELHKKRYEVGV